MSTISVVLEAPPLFGALSLMSLDINGPLRKVKKGNKMVLKYRELGRHLVAKNVNFAVILEPNFNAHPNKQGQYYEVNIFFSNIGYELMLNFPGEGRGRVAAMGEKIACSCNERGPQVHSSW